MCMRLLVLSDSHRDAASLRMIAEKHKEADIIVFLGDGEDDFEHVRPDLSGKIIYAVRGNCDWYSSYPECVIFNVGRVKVYASHGYREAVKYGTDMLLKTTDEAGCSLALYGHTHEAKLEYRDGIYLFCPGSVRDGAYGLVDITDAGIMCINAVL